MRSRDLLFEFWDPLHISGTVEGINFKFGWQIGHWGTNEKKTQNYQFTMPLRTTSANSQI